MKKKLLFDVVNASVPEPITVSTEMGICYSFFFVLLLVGNAERCAENENVIQDAEATAICGF